MDRVEEWNLLGLGTVQVCNNREEQVRDDEAATSGKNENVGLFYLKHDFAHN